MLNLNENSNGNPSKILFETSNSTYQLQVTDPLNRKFTYEKETTLSVGEWVFTLLDGTDEDCSITRIFTEDDLLKSWIITTN